MGVKELRNQLGDFAKDTRLNLGSVLSEEGAPGLTRKQIAGIALASAYAARTPDVVNAVMQDATAELGEAELHAAQTAASLMAMNNVYYRFTHLVSNTAYRTMPAKLRMNAMANPGIEKTDFELYSLAVSAINGCGMCVDAHEQTLKKASVSEEAIQSCVRIAAVIHAAAVSMEIAALAQPAPV